MIKPAKLIVLFLCGILFFFCETIEGREVGDKNPVITHADAAIILAKYSGFFDRYVDQDAGLSECVSFLNRAGVYFGLMEVVNTSEYTKKDCARSMGQIELVLSGEAELLEGKVKLPKGVESWQDFCMMNDVKYREGYQTMQRILNQTYTGKE